MKIRQVFFHGNRLLIKNTTVAGGTHQLNDRKKDDIGLFADDMVLFHLFQIVGIKLLRFLRHCVLKGVLEDSPGEIL